MRTPSFQSLTAFEVAARTGSFSAAANELCITPSALSHRIRLLEEFLDGKLFIRSGRKVILSELGRRYLIVVENSLDALRKFSASPNSKEKKSVKITVTPTFARMRLIPELQSFLKHHPDINIEIFLSVPLYDLKLANSDIEICYGGKKEDDLVSQKINHDYVFPVASPGYLKKIGALKSPCDIYKTALLTSPLEPWQPWFERCQLNFSEAQTSLCFHDLGLLLEATQQGYGVCLARKQLVARLLQSNKLVEICNFRINNPTFSYHIFYKKSEIERPEVKLFSNWLSNTFCNKEEKSS